MKPNLTILDGEFAVHRFGPDIRIPARVFGEDFFSITRTDEELSLVCPAAVSLDARKSEAGWSCIKVLGPLDFALTGILAEISGVLAREKISIFAVSTFDTDYILVKSETLKGAKAALEKNGYRFPISLP